MPPKAKITRDMILDAAFTLARTEGAEAVNARTVAQQLNCSTQPVMYQFKTIEELKTALYEKANAYHSAFLMDIRSEDPMKDIGLNYIRFGATNQHLFRFLFQSNEFSGKNLGELVGSAELQPLFGILSREAGVSEAQAKTLFRSLFLFAHGYASMFANNDLTYDEEAIAADLELVFAGALCTLKGGA